jgi:hypothetical protein
MTRILGPRPHGLAVLAIGERDMDPGPSAIQIRQATSWRRKSAASWWSREVGSHQREDACGAARASGGENATAELVELHGEKARRAGLLCSGITTVLVPDWIPERIERSLFFFEIKHPKSIKTWHNRRSPNVLH